jgi:hypothetical protein
MEFTLDFPFIRDLLKQEQARARDEIRESPGFVTHWRTKSSIEAVFTIPSAIPSVRFAWRRRCAPRSPLLRPIGFSGPGMHQDFKELLSAFNAGQVRYLIVGGYAVSYKKTPCSE